MDNYRQVPRLSAEGYRSSSVTIDINGRLCDILAFDPHIAQAVGECRVSGLAGTTNHHYPARR
jgi:hypothetical protein